MPANIQADDKMRLRRRSRNMLQVHDAAGQQRSSANSFPNRFACSQSNEQERAGLKLRSPNLWVSTDMLVTPGTEKSKSGTG
jgi:hypothetical protein